VSGLCARCGVGQRRGNAPCDWCGAPARVRVPCWVINMRGLRRSRAVAALCRRGPVAAGIVVGVAAQLIVTAVAVAAGIPALWQAGFLWSEQWWWALAPEAVQPWGFALTQGAVYGALAGWVAGWRTGERRPPTLREASTPPPDVASAATVTGLVAFVVAGLEPSAGTEQQLVAAALGAIVGRLTINLWRGRRR
jgi:hypothetical protein